MSTPASTPGTADGKPTAGSRREQLRLQQEAEVRRARTKRMVGIAAAIIALALIAIVATVTINNQRTKVREATAAGMPPNANADASGIVVNPGKATSGAPTVTVYQDYQCPICKQVEAASGEQLNALADKGEIALEYRTMTFMDANLSNTASTRAARAAVCADKAGVYRQYHDQIFTHQQQQEIRGSEGYSDALLRDQIPAAVGLGGDKLTAFQQCYDSKVTQDFVTGTNEKAGQTGVTGTPTYKVNGKALDYQQMTRGITEQQLLELIRTTAAS